MLTHRTNLLLSEKDHQMLTQVARDKGITMGELIRTTLRKIYRYGKKQNNTLAVFARIDRLAKKADTKEINYRELISYGRHH